MSRLLWSFLFLSWGILGVNNPYLMASLFFLLLLCMSCLMATYSKFVAFVMFIVYIGGLMILISYCVMLMPVNKFSKIRILPLFAGIGVFFIGTPVNAYSFGLVYSFNAILLVAMILYLVILAVVDIVNYSRGIMYDQYNN